MNKKLKRVLDDIEKTEKKIAAWQEHLHELNVYKEQLEDQEILKSFHSLDMDSWSLLDVLDKIQAGEISFCSKGDKKELLEANVQNDKEEKEHERIQQEVEEEDKL